MAFLMYWRHLMRYGYDSNTNMSNARRTDPRGNKGFTLMEMLIVVAIVAVLIAIAIPVLSVQVERSKQAVDLANMRSAYAAATYEWSTSEDAGKAVTYFYTGTGVTKSREGITGYGKSTHDAKEFSDELPVYASGIPNRDGQPCYITVRMNANGVGSILWGGAYAGQNVLSQDEYSGLTYDQKLAKDKLLVDSLQDEFRNMTYGELRNLFMNPDGTIKDGITVSKLSDGNMCVTLAYGTVNTDGNIVTGDKKTNIYFEELFNNVGYNTRLDYKYIINSVNDKTNTIWVNLRIKQSDLKSLSDSDERWNERAASSYTYVKSGGATTPDPLREAVRNKQ